jgi:hypothetical protein
LTDKGGTAYVALEGGGVGLRKILFSAIFMPAICFAGSGFMDMIEAQISAAEQIYDALTLKEEKSVSGDVHFRYKATLNPGNLQEGGLYCERRSSTDCSLVSTKGLKGKVVVLEGEAAKKIFDAFDPAVAKIQHINNSTSYYKVGGLLCMKSLHGEVQTYTCTASSL